MKRYKISTLIFFYLTLILFMSFLLLFFVTTNTVGNFQDISSLNSAYSTEYIYLTFFFIIIFLTCLLFILLLLKYRFLRSIEKLRDQIHLLGKGKFDVNIKEASRVKEIHDISISLNKIGEKLRNYNHDLEEELKTRHEIEDEMELAGRVQGSVLPKVTDEFKNRKYELYSKVVPAKGMSGDFYDYFYVNNETLAIILADVSGKGMPAAFFMSMAKVIIKKACLSSRKLNPALILEKINKSLCKENDSRMFLSMYLFLYNIETGKILYSNAGHHEFITVTGSGFTKTAGIFNSTVIGLNEKIKYRTGEIQLEPGQLIAAYTDGIKEAPDRDGIEFGTDSLLQLFANKYRRSLNDLGEYVIKKVLDYQKGRRFDDITLVMLRRSVNDIAD